MEKDRLKAHLKKMIHALANINQDIFSMGDYRDFLSLCNNDISILALLKEHPGETAKQISIRLGLPKTTVVTAVSRLVTRGYIQREQSVKDGREQLLMLTNKGDKVNVSHEQYEKKFLEAIINLFNEDDYDTLADILERSKICNITK